MTTPPLLEMESRGEMTEGTARIVAITGETAWLEAESKSSCGGCKASKGCGVSVLSGVVGNKPVRFRLRNTFGGKVGDRIVIGIPEGALLRASLIAYMLPMVCMIGAALGTIGLGGDDPAAAIAAVGGLALGFVAMKLFSGKLKIQPIFLRKDSGDAADAASCGVDLKF